MDGYSAGVDIHISLSGRRDLANDIYRQLRQAIVGGLLRAGEALPATRVLARHLSVSRTTVTVAYERLLGEGFVTARIGAGTFVADHGLAARPVPRRHGPSVLQPQSIWASLPLSTPFARPARFDFRSGIPDGSLFPHDRWRRIAMRAARQGRRDLGIYGAAAGHAGLRDAIARHIAVSRAVNTSADDVTIVNGTQQALDLVGRILLAPGDRVAVEDPGYRPARLLFQSLGASVVGVPVDRDGLVVDALPRQVRLVYVTPSHQYPLGMSMSLTRRRALLAWADRTNAAIVEDDYDSEFRFGGRPIEPLQTLDSVGRVIYVGSFSKTMLPALRLGFMVVPSSLREALHKVKQLTDWHSAWPLQAALALFIESGDFARHVRRMSHVYRTRHARMTETLARDFADSLEVQPSAAGLHLAAIARRRWARHVPALIRTARAADVAVQDLATSSINGQGTAGLLLGFGAIALDRLDEGLSRLRRCFDEVGSRRS